MNKILIIIFIGFFLRLFTIFYFANLNNDYYWEYGAIGKNLVNGNGYSLFYYTGSQLEHRSNKNAVPYKSAFMPPGYVFFLVPFLLIKDIFIRNILLLIFQNIISILSIYLLYKLCLKIFSQKAAIVSALIASITPEFVYSILSFTPTVLYHLLLIMLLGILVKKNKSIKDLIYIGILISIIIYFRAEFILFGLILVSYYLFVKKIRNSIFISGIIIIFLLPWGVRNYLTFHRIIPLTTSLGLNIYRGNNPYDIGTWGNQKIFDELNANKNDNFEIKMNQIYEKNAFAFIIRKPIQTLYNSGKKLIYYWSVNLNWPRERNIIYLISTFFLLLSFIYGFIKSFSYEKYKYFYLFLIYSSIIVAVFFPLPRYQTMMRIALIPFCGFGISYLIDAVRNFIKSQKRFV